MEVIEMRGVVASDLWARFPAVRILHLLGDAPHSKDSGNWPGQDRPDTGTIDDLSAEQYGKLAGRDDVVRFCPFDAKRQHALCR